MFQTLMVPISLGSVFNSMAQATYALAWVPSLIMRIHWLASSIDLAGSRSRNCSISLSERRKKIYSLSSSEILLKFKRSVEREGNGLKLSGSIIKLQIYIVIHQTRLMSELFPGFYFSFDNYKQGM